MLRAIVIDPEVVFVANLMKADAPALVASFQCDFSLCSAEAAQVMKVNLKGLKILACPFIRNKDSKAVTTVCFYLVICSKCLFINFVQFNCLFNVLYVFTRCLGHALFSLKPVLYLVALSLALWL